MAENDLYYTGGTIIMDHGHGISTIYSHLENVMVEVCLLYTSPSPRDQRGSRMPSSA